jgi:transcriptional regulator with XRE-family HTH domain
MHAKLVQDLTEVVMSGRIDTELLRSALDAQRKARGLSWRQVALEAKVSPSLLSRIGNGQRPDLDGFIALVQWLGSPAEDFMTRPEASTTENPQSTVEAQVAALLRAQKDLDETDRTYLLEIVEATMRKIRADRRGAS